MTITSEKWRVALSKKYKFRDAAFIVSGREYIGKAYGHDGQNFKENATLMAAAPELLIQCKKSLEYIEKTRGLLGGEKLELTQQLREVIRKTEGVVEL